MVEAKGAAEETAQTESLTPSDAGGRCGSEGSRGSRADEPRRGRFKHGLFPSVMLENLSRFAAGSLQRCAKQPRRRYA